MDIGSIVFFVGVLVVVIWIGGSGPSGGAPVTHA